MNQDKTNDVFHDMQKMIRGLRNHIDETDCKHCKELFRKIFEENKK